LRFDLFTALNPQTLLVGLSLSIDALAVSLGAGLSTEGIKKSDALRASFFFGLFQFFMPIAGALMGGAFVSYIAAFDHWVAFALLAFIGLRMVIPQKAEKGGPQTVDLRATKTLLVLALATSLDALAVGLSYSMLGESIVDKALVIGLITFCVCLAGFVIGKRSRVRARDADGNNGSD
jgi:putative Mn2+ efflux pump MntP